MADRGHVRHGTIAAMSLVIASFALAALGRVRFWPLLVTGIVMDLGVQANVVFGQLARSTSSTSTSETGSTPCT